MVARRDDRSNNNDDDDDEEEEEELAGEDDMLMLQDAIEDGAAVAGDPAGLSKPRPSTSANRGTALKDMSPNKCHNLVMVLLVLLNTMLLMYSHLGTSGLILSNLQALASHGRRDLQMSSSPRGGRGLGACNRKDEARWETQTLADTLQSVKGCLSCMGNTTCMTACVVREGSFSTPCATCLADVVDCAMKNCLFQCASDPSAPKCASCLEAKCVSSFATCSGLSVAKLKAPTAPPSTPATAPPTTTSSSQPSSEGPSSPPTEPARSSLPPTRSPTAKASESGLSSTAAEKAPATNAASADPNVQRQPETTTDPCSELASVYEVRFLDAVSKAWNNGAKVLALILFVASGVWPYVKNILLLVAWHRPMEKEQRMRLLVWLCRLGKWSFVDVFVMLLFNATLRIEKQLSTSMTLIVYATPQAGIYAFCAAASLALAQSEWMRRRHEGLCSVEALTASDATVARGGIFNSGDSGRLRSGWRTATTRSRVRSRLLHERGSLYLRLLVPAVGFLSLLVGFYGTTLVHCEIQGSLSYLPGQNDFSYTGAEMMRSASGVSSCESSRGVRDHPWVREVLVWLLLIAVVGLPIISFIAVSLLWIIGAGVPCKPRYFKQVLLNSAHRLMQLVEVAANLACLDVFLVSLLVVSSEIGNVVRAVGATVQTSTMSISLDLSLGSGAVCLVFAAILLLVLNILTHFEAPALRNTLALAAGRGSRNVYDEIDAEDSDEDTSFVI